MVLTDSPHHIRSIPLLMDQGIFQGEGAISGPSNSCAHRRATQFQSYLVHNSAQIFLSVIQTQHLCDGKKLSITSACKYELRFPCGSTKDYSPRVNFGGWKRIQRKPFKIGGDFPSGPSKPRAASSYASCDFMSTLEYLNRTKRNCQQFA